MDDIVICQPTRTPIGRFGGSFRSLQAHELAAVVLRAIIERTGIDPKTVDDVVLGQAYPNSEAPGLGRVVALDAGLPVTTTGMQLDRRCASGIQSVIFGAMLVQTGAAELVAAGGAESMSNAEHYTLGLRWGGHSDFQLSDRLSRGRITAGGKNYPVDGGMLETAENLRRDLGISREDQDRVALRSHQRAVEAQTAGKFAKEIVPVPVSGSASAAITMDEHPRRETSLQSLAALVPIRIKVDSESTVTAGNSSGQNDGAALCLVTRSRRAEELGLRPLLRLRSWASAGVEPSRMGIGPVPASELALRRANLTLDDMGVIELNEAFAAQALAVTRTWGLDDDDSRVNPNGSGISLGHAVGATGARMLATLAFEMQRTEVRFGLLTLCAGGGQGIAAIFERVQ